MGAAYNTVLVAIGDELGFCHMLTGQGPLTGLELADHRDRRAVPANPVTTAARAISSALGQSPAYLAGVVRWFVVEALGGQPLRVGALDESRQEKQGRVHRWRQAAVHGLCGSGRERGEHGLLLMTPTLMTLVRVACLRWPVEEGFEFGKGHFGLGPSQVRLYTALLRHIVLTLAGLAVTSKHSPPRQVRLPY